MSFALKGEMLPSSREDLPIFKGVFLGDKESANDLNFFYNQSNLRFPVPGRALRKDFFSLLHRSAFKTFALYSNNKSEKVDALAVIAHRYIDFKDGQREAIYLRDLRIGDQLKYFKRWRRVLKMVVDRYDGIHSIYTLVDQKNTKWLASIDLLGRLGVFYNKFGEVRESILLIDNKINHVPCLYEYSVNNDDDYFGFSGEFRDWSDYSDANCQDEEARQKIFQESTLMTVKDNNEVVGFFRVWDSSASKTYPQDQGLKRYYLLQSCFRSRLSQKDKEKIIQNFLYQLRFFTFKENFIFSLNEQAFNISSELLENLRVHQNIFNVYSVNNHHINHPIQTVALTTAWI